MARRVGQSVGALPRTSVRAIYEDFRPFSEWIYGNEAQQSHFLLVQLPGFAKEQLKVSTEGINTLKIRGERFIEGNRWNRFEEDFRIPDDCNLRGIRAKFESDTLTITMPKKSPTTTRTQVSPPKEETSRAHLEAPLKMPNKEQETKEKINSKVVEEVKEIKKDEIVKEDVGNKAKEADEGNGKILFRPESNFEKSEKRDEEISREVNEKENKKTQKAAEWLYKEHEEVYEEYGKEKGKGKGSSNYLENTEEKANEKIGKVEEKEIEKSQKVMEGLKIKETSEKGSYKPENYLEKTTKKVAEASGERKEKGNEKYKEVMEGFDTGSNTNEYRKAKGSFYPESYIKNGKMKAKEGTSRREKENENVKRKYEEVVKGKSKGEIEEERQLMVNMGVAVLVIVALGAYITCGLCSNGKSKA